MQRLAHALFHPRVVHCADAPVRQPTLEVVEDEHFVDLVSADAAKKASSNRSLGYGLAFIVVTGSAMVWFNRGKGALPNQLMHARLYMQAAVVGSLSCLAAYQGFIKEYMQYEKDHNLVASGETKV
ncbi:hypothetical protein FVE85_9223 [Porphyridium purpureum]|uniref:HIG1 domain-containing protein n=1 Tax=Porphyridium purpureum TaxID=35688 RepID=A0A5J4YN71_PORPP|nr:hypothetical protein FVE85_9223 [Porphyridium purpureum]|eukprot:POR3530..scf222_8